MYRILSKRILHETVVAMEVESARIAQKARPGQFIIFRLDEDGERVPLTIAATDVKRAAVMIIFQTIGKSTQALSNLDVGDQIRDFVGPLGRPSELDSYAGKKVAVIGGGLGAAIAYPQAKYLHEAGAEVEMIVGFRNQEMIILKEEMEAASAQLYICTDDGSNGLKGYVTNVLEERLKEVKYDLVLAVGPLLMMKAVAEMTRPLAIKTIVSMNTIMIDGTGMCGGCRLTVGGQTKFACVDGPDFDAHLVDFDEAHRRSKTYKRHEKESMHACNLHKGALQ